jgi:hypothetical protein
MIFLKTERIIQRVKGFFSGYGYTPLYLCGVKKNKEEILSEMIRKGTVKTKRRADPRRPSNTGH